MPLHIGMNVLWIQNCLHTSYNHLFSPAHAVNTSGLLLVHLSAAWEAYRVKVSLIPFALSCESCELYSHTPNCKMASLSFYNCSIYIALLNLFSSICRMAVFPYDIHPIIYLGVHTYMSGKVISM